MRNAFQAGFSTIEMLIAIFVGAILMAGVAQIADTSGESFRIQSGVMAMQQNGQFAMSHISKDIRNIDFWGCVPNGSSISNLLSGGGGFTTPIAPLTGTANASGTGSQLAGTDTITMQGVLTVGSGSQVVVPYMTTSASAVTVSATTGISTGTILLISDCLGGDIFQATGVAASAISHVANAGSPGNVSANLSKVYDGTASIYLPYTHTYDIRTGAWGGPSLFLTTSTGTQELVAGVQNMVILYGEDLNNDGVADNYVRANAVTNMNNVINVRVMLLMETTDNNLNPQPIPYTFNGTTVTPTDNRLREVLTQTMLIRNRSK